ncbi:MAG: DUF1223 domain-containing protein [Opitutales bacterium]
MCVIATALRGEPVRFASGPTQTALIELFTSEGCSSCPPAERWLATLRDAPGLWHDFVPVAFHVDYWNRLGWPDRFSTREFTQRQYDYAAAWGGSSVYTPCLVRDGAEQGGTRLPTPSGIAAGRLTVSYDGTTLHSGFSLAAPRAGETFEIHAAILGGGITSRVTAGENSGETLHHEFIALALVHAPLGRDLTLPVPKVAGVARHALAVWVTRPGELAALQATGGWID